ncbi:hypothetical protein OsI_26230 [Oryza sativa Indica Group]|uniref:Uncharacterized protein n=1 Tax=Oryza sativa subsp. indica TaxID=39946 RepID=A2YLY1_ORYSI|nr:hypothetical protein OsI_26230 [Oryza sativa Indica Group]
MAAATSGYEGPCTRGILDAARAGDVEMYKHLRGQQRGSPLNAVAAAAFSPLCHHGRAAAASTRTLTVIEQIIGSISSPPHHPSLVSYWRARADPPLPSTPSTDPSLLWLHVDTPCCGHYRGRYRTKLEAAALPSPTFLAMDPRNQRPPPLPKPAVMPPEAHHHRSER